MNAKKKLVRNLIIAITVIGLLSGIYCFVLNWNPEEETTFDSEPDIDTIYVVSENIEDVSSVTVRNLKGEYEIIQTNSDIADYTISQLNGYEVNKSSLSAAFSGMVKLNAYREITKDTSNMDDFGISESVSYTLNKNDGSYITVLFGDEVPTGGEFYCMLEGGDTIYTVSAYKMDIVLKAPDDYRVTKICSVADVSDISAFSVYHNNKSVLKIRKSSDKELESSILTGSWMIEYPWVEYTNEEKITELFNPFVSINAIGFSKDNPDFDYRVEFIAGTDSYKLAIGPETEEGVYLKDESSGNIYVVNSKIREVIEEINPNNFITKLVSLADISKVSRVVINFDDIKYIMEPGIEDEKPYYINGVETEEEVFKDKYQLVIGILFKERGDYSVVGTPVLTIKYEYINGEYEEINYYQYDERNYIAVRADGTTVKVLSSEVEKIKKLILE